MSNLTVFLAFVLAVAPFRGTMVAAQNSGLHLPAPSYPVQATVDHMVGSGMCMVVFDAAGHVQSAVMSQSTGFKLLDENTTRFARTHWTGPPNTLVRVPVNYVLSHGSKFPPVSCLSRAGTCRVVLNASGHSASAVMAKSTGSESLDTNILDWVRTRYVGPPRVTKDLPFVGISAPEPWYPYKMRAEDYQGAGVYKVDFDASGRVANVVVTQSVGRSALDVNTEDFARTRWTGPPNAMAFVLVTYRLW